MILDHENSLNRVRDDYDLGANNMREEQTQLRGQFEDDLASMRAETDKLVKNAGEEMDALNKLHREEQRELSKKNDQELEKLRSSHKRSVEEVHQEHKQATQHLRDEHQLSLKHFEEAIAKLKSENSAKIKELLGEKDDLVVSNDKKVSKLREEAKDKLENLLEENTQRERDWGKATEALKKSNSMQIAKLSTEHSEAIIKLQLLHEKNIEDQIELRTAQTKNHEDNTKEIKDTLAEKSRHSIEQTTKRYETRINQLKLDCEDNLFSQIFHYLDNH